MTFGAALVLGAVLAACIGPAVLRRLAEGARDPLTLIICWIGSIVTVPATFAVGVGLLLLPGGGPAGVFGHLARHCWAALRHGSAPEVDELLGAFGAAAIIFLVARFGQVAAQGARARRRVYRAHLGLRAVTEPAAQQPPTVLWLTHARPVAYSVGGHPGLVVASSGLRTLPAAQMAAVLTHERAHLRGRHHQLVAVAQALAAAAPMVPLFRHAPAAMRLLVELAADASAARLHGRRAVRAALLALQGPVGSQHALAMADGDLGPRLTRLQPGRPPASILRRTGARAVAVLAIPVVPAIVGLGTMLVVVAVFCPA